MVVIPIGVALALEKRDEAEERRERETGGGSCTWDLKSIMLW